MRDDTHAGTLLRSLGHLLVFTAVVVPGLVGCSSHSVPAAVATSAADALGLAQGSGALPAVRTRSRPTGLRIPAIGVSSTLIPLGLAADGTLQVPPSGTSAGWFTGAPTPGERGPAVIVGHVDWNDRKGVFYRLHELKPGDQVLVSRADGTTVEFEVNAVRQFAKDHFPTRLVYGNLLGSGLRLITCGGSFHSSTRSYEDNIVVFAVLVQ